MAAARPVLMTMREFRRMKNFSGEVRVQPGSRTRKGVRRHRRQASCNSPEGKAGTVARSRAAGGESAHSSAAHATSRFTDTDLAEPKANRVERTPLQTKKKGSKTRSVAAGGKGGGGAVESLWEERSMLDGGDPLPKDGPGFVDSVNDYIDLVRTTELLLRDQDAKSSKSLLELLLEMKYGSDARATLVANQSGTSGSMHPGS